jgi:hypothetical protein
MKKILFGMFMIMSIGVIHAQVNNKVIIHIGGQVFTVDGDVDLGMTPDASKIVEGDSTIIKLPNVTIITNSKKHTKEIYINGGSTDISSGTGSTYMNFGQHIDSMFNNRHNWGINIPDSGMFQNIPNFSFNWNWGNFPGNIDSMMNFNRKWMDSLGAQNRNGQVPQQHYYNLQGNSDSGAIKEKMQEKIEDLKQKLNDLQEKLNDMNEKLNESSSNNHSYVPEDSTEIRIGNLRISINDNGVKINQPDTSSHNTSCTHEKNIKTHWILLDVGFDNYLNNFSTNLPAGYSGLELIQGKSVNINLQLFQQSINIYRQHLFFEYGVAFDFYNYRFRQNSTLIPKIDSVKFAEASTQLSKNKLSDTYVTIPIVFQYESSTNYSKALHLGIGMNVGYLITSHTKQVSTQYGKVKDWDSYDLNSFNYGPTLRIGFSWFNLYANYGLNGLFRSGSAPLLNPLSFGISIIAD